MNNIFILAGTYDQFKLFISQLYNAAAEEGIVLHRQQLIYVTPQSLRGCRNIWGYKCGTWQNRDDIEAITQQIAVSGSSFEEDFIEVDI